MKYKDLIEKLLPFEVMAQEDEELLLIDLCARLPYEVKIKRTYIDAFGVLATEEDVFCGDDFDSLTTKDERWATYKQWTVVPYLRPLSSMTEEEINEFILITDTVLRLGDKRLTCILSLEQMNWLNAHHFDYRGLIEKGLALEAPEGMYKTE